MRFSLDFGSEWNYTLVRVARGNGNRFNCMYFRFTLGLDRTCRVMVGPVASAGASTSPGIFLRPSRGLFRANTDPTDPRFQTQGTEAEGEARRPRSGVGAPGTLRHQVGPRGSETPRTAKRAVREEHPSIHAPEGPVGSRASWRKEGSGFVPEALQVEGDYILRGANRVELFRSPASTQADPEGLRSCDSPVRLPCV